MAVNRLAYFFAGAVLGAAGLAMVKSGKGQQLVSGMISGGCGLAENVLTRVETVKEDIEDYMAEVKYKAAQAKEAAAQEETVAAADVEIDVEPEAASEVEEESTTDSVNEKA
ncbi:hypothetical protein [Halodesulfovibrio spirochaetisodalis]|uniref:hypothetical protein n=1 Tax=Halodesulfovibrio spirochaetisodalis TaxID=1560234 RepID=UPI000833D935|nr:hypothetical protein [Halodesulfovibrio spirochaetisodalis]